MTNDPFERAVERAEAAAERADTEHRQRRQERWASGQRKGFRIHATVFVAVQVLLIAVWVLAWQVGGTSYPWFIYPLLGWGIGLVAHYAAVHEHFNRK
jgi:fatty acid desaturase